MHNPYAPPQVVVNQGGGMSGCGSAAWFLIALFIIVPALGVGGCLVFTCVGVSAHGGR